VRGAPRTSHLGDVGDRRERSRPPLRCRLDRLSPKATGHGRIALALRSRVVERWCPARCRRPVMSSSLVVGCNPVRRLGCGSPAAALLLRLSCFGSGAARVARASEEPRHGWGAELDPVGSSG
jgi:hypothetical protein